MGYSDQKFYARPQTMQADSGVATGTFTAGAACNQPLAFALPKFDRRTKVTNVKVVVKTASAANTTAVTLNFLNGTSTFAVVAITPTTATAGSEVAATMTLANATFSAASGPSVTVLGTATASAQTYGAHEVFFEVQELP